MRIDENNKQTKETHGFKSTATPTSNELLQPFEDDLYNMIKNVEFRKVKCNFQNKLQNDIKEIKESPDVLVSADKTTNFYSVTTADYKKLLTENITKGYKKN